MQRVRDRKRLVQVLPQHAVVAEIGVQRGRFAKAIWRYARPRRLHLIDCWAEQQDERYRADTANVDDRRQEENYRRTVRRLARGIALGQVVLHRGFSVPVLATFPDAYFDWVYIDANHTYEGCRADLEACLPKMKPAGVIAGHDYIDTPYWRQRHYGVVQAVDEFCAEHGWELACLSEEPGNEINRQGNPSFALCRAGQQEQAIAPRSRRWPFTSLRRAA